MSGGVDSSVAAALLVEQGYEVIGCTMQVWDYSKDSSCEIVEGNGTCCSSIDVDDARAVADHLGIPFYVINCEEPFEHFVIKDFINSYLEGRTPIPCVHCNTFLKFDHLLKKMKELRCDYLATGHYAESQEISDSRWGLITSEDSWKDQTYFLFTLQTEILPKLIFPVGKMEKPKVRQLAEEMGLPVAKKRDSTGICFIGNKGYKNFLEENVPKEKFKPGLLKRWDSGETLGEHSGIHNFTYGQRKGLGISSEKPLYVVKVDPMTCEVWLGEEEELYSTELEVDNVNWLDEFNDDEKLRVKVRFAHQGAQANILKTEIEGRYKIVFDEKQRAITPGQAAVVYRDRQLIGGGWIL
ncbi:MAG: tRNA 2-thiouridine(34) synthase MnmA [Bdellovibrionaceae bacterium]|nr:tRNA 2-thiouridine(34) synthase MnmA [Pseudobdellovibrionaceae bacterium]